MAITQDDLWTLHHLRAAWAGGTDADASEASLAQWPGRAEGRVASWAFARGMKVLARGARRRVRIGEGLAPSPDEAALLRTVRALGARDWHGAEEAALWLVRRDAVGALTEALAPAACAYGNAAPRRRQAARA